MGIQASNTDKELKKNKFETANHADTIQPKSIYGLQNHADTQKLIRVKTAAEQSNRNEKLTQFKTAAEQSNRNEKLTQFKTAAEQSNRNEKLTQFKTAAEQSNHHKKLTQFKTEAEQSNRHEKLTQLQSMGDARAQKIQNGGVVQFGGGKKLFESAAKQIVKTGRGAAQGPGRGAAQGPGRGAARAAAFGAAGVTGLSVMGKVNTGLDVADKISDIAAHGTLRDGNPNKILENAIGLAEISVDKSSLPDFIKKATTTFLKTLGKLAPIIELKAQSKEGDISNLFIDDKDRLIGEAIRQFSSIIDGFGIPNPLAGLISIDNMRSRYIALIKIIKDEELIQLKHEDGIKENEAHGKLKQQHPDVAEFNRANEGKSDKALLADNSWANVPDVDW